MSSDRTPADAQEAWLTDACSVIGQHCGSDGSDDEHNDWINDLANALWDTLVQHPVTRAEVDPTNLREVVAGVRAEFEQAVTDPELDTGMANWLDALNAHLGAAVRGVTAEPDSAADRTPNELADRLYRWANGQPRGLADDLRAAAVLLREQSEQLDTLRNEVLRHRRMVEGCELVHPLPTLIEQVNGDLWAAAGGGVPEEGATDE